MDTAEMVEATLGVLEKMIEGLGNKLVEVKGENEKLKNEVHNLKVAMIYSKKFDEMTVQDLREFLESLKQ